MVKDVEGIDRSLEELEKKTKIESVGPNPCWYLICYRYQHFSLKISS